MGIVKYVIDLLGFTQDNNQGSKVNLVNATKRKRAPEDEDGLFPYMSFLDRLTGKA